jgi:hypothetical protein
VAEAAANGNPRAPWAVGGRRKRVFGRLKVQGRAASQSHRASQPFPPTSYTFSHGVMGIVLPVVWRVPDFSMR